MANKSEEAKAAISLPKGGGAIKGIGETFQPNLFSGTGNFSVPIFASPGRNGFGPQLTVQYSTGSGNGPFGLGWQLSIPRVTRKTEKGLPTYTDQDVFVMSGAEDLVPHLERVSDDPEQWEPVVAEQGEFTISLYRPRTEGQFARMERWMSADGDIHWRAITKENVTSIYGRTPAARIIDPDQSDHVFEWLLEETFDAKGNHIAYEYIHEDSGLRLPGIHEHNRNYTQAYIRRILYGNTPENLEMARRVGPIRTATDHINPLETRERHYLFEILFDYGDLPENLNIPDDLSHEVEHTIPSNWPIREDPFSTFRSGFEIRTLRRCRRVLMCHHFKEGELEGAPLVKSTDFQYAVNPDTQLSLLTLATVSGYRKDPDDPQRYLKRDMPPVTFKYTEFEPHKERYQSVTANGQDLPPRSLNAPDFTAMDVFGNGLPDILQDTGSGIHYWENLGQGQLDLRRPQSGDQPAHSFAEAKVSIGDMGGDGLADLVVDAPPISGFYESTPDGRWKSFRRFVAMPSFDLSDPNTRLVDLTGDGLSDVLVTRDTHFLWFRCQGEVGYDEPRSIPRKHDLELFPDVYFDDPAGRVRLADMTGDGLSDIVLVHDGRIDYWPNLGYGRFGRRITMANTPRIGFDFDPRRMFLADLDGTGCADLVFVDHGEVHFWFNQSGNAWSGQQTINGTPDVSDLTAVQFIDFYGTGTTTLLWSYDFGQHSSGSNYKILDFCGGKKPNLLIEMDNNMGATTRVQYAPSTKFYLEDKANGTPWNTSLPFPVQVLEKTEVIDHISKTKLVTTYKYHHGYYDGREREFRGFGRVDQFDTEFFDDFSGSSLHGDGATFDNNQQGFHVPPVETRSWFHTGIYFDTDRYLDHRELTEQYRSEYYQGDEKEFLLGEHDIEQSVITKDNGDSPHEAFRALRGAVLRTEVYGRDGSVKASHPYVVTDNRYRVKALQPKDGNNHAVYLTTPTEGVSYHYERNPADPRISQNITLGIDDFGNVTDSVSIGYPRRVVPEELPEQGETKIIYTHNDSINNYSPPIATIPAFYYAGIPCQTRSYEVTGIDWRLGLPHLDAQLFDSIQDETIDVDTSSFMPYEWERNETDSGIHRRIIEWTRNYFRADANPSQIDSIGNLDHRLALGEIESLALPYEAYQAVFTVSLLQNIYAGRTVDIDLPGEGGYHPHPTHATSEGEGGIEDYLWIPSGRQNFDPEKFFQTDRAQDPFGNSATTELDAYALLVKTVRDALPAPLTNVMLAKNDYRVLQAFEVTDPNGNRSQVAFDALGLVVGTAIMGEDAQGNSLGDSLDGFVADLIDDVRDRHIEDPLNLDTTHDTNPHNILKNATTRLVYDINRFTETGQPIVVYTLTRETHVSDEQGTPSKIQHAFVYSDGFGRESQTKVQAEPDPAEPAKPRWVGTGTTVYNNKGKAVQQYEPFFSDEHHHAIEQHGVSPTLFYDPLERVVCTVHPNHTYEKVLFDSWQQTTWDSNDTVLLDPRIDPDVIQYVDNYFLQYDRDYQDQHGEPPQTWHQEQILSDDTARKTTAIKTEPHANTPTVAHLDTLARPFLTIADNGLDDEGNEQKFTTRMVLDIENNQREVIDALDRIVMRYDYDLLSNPTHQASMEAGERWMLNDVAGSPIYAWDSRGHSFRTEYDPLRRPLRSFVTGANPANPDQELLTERLVYGEQHPQASQRNLRGGLYLYLDQAGAATTEAHDFKGNPLRATRRIAIEYKQAIDWSAVDAALPDNAMDVLDLDALEAALAPLLEADTYKSSTTYDALDRPVTMTTPHTPAMRPSIIRPGYNEANLLERVEANLRSQTDAADEPIFTSFVTNIDYDAKGQHQRIDFGNGVTTAYTYDKETFRLTNLRTTRTSDGDLQNLFYTYDPAGNITHIRDDAQQTIYFRNQRVEPSNDYTYDAIYRLIDATGREHLGQTGGAPHPHSHDDAQRVGLLHRGDGDAMGTYIERYVYDAVGNFLEMRHRGSDLTHPGWTRSYAYDEVSQIEPAEQSNRLSHTTVGNANPITERYVHDAHGNMVEMPHLGGVLPGSNMHWDYRDQLRQTDLGGGGTAFYTYDASGERVRKVWEKSANLVEERLYLGGFEIYRKRQGAERLERETLHIMDDQQRIALVEMRTLDTAGTDTAPAQLIRYQFGNHLGSASVELDDQALIISYEEYTPFGSTSYQAVRSQIDTPKRYRYSGKERDEESGLNYHGARHYIPWLGRWNAADPTGLVDGANLFHYASNNPIRLADPEGRQPENPEDKAGSNFIFPWELKPELADKELFFDFADHKQRVENSTQQNELQTPGAFTGTLQKGWG